MTHGFDWEAWPEVSIAEFARMLDEFDHVREDGMGMTLYRERATGRHIGYILLGDPERYFIHPGV